MGIIIIPGQEEQPEEVWQAIPHDQLRELVREAVEHNRHAIRKEPVQANLDRLIEECYSGEQIEFAAALLLVEAALVTHCLKPLLESLLQTMAELTPVVRASQACRLCGCTNGRPCIGGCEWVEIDLCSRCAEEEDSRVITETEGGAR